ncbi:DUF3606 domain-containing protein [Floridanema evergladense]|uniref:DUF3606 domain-containing protein n=1 Tax=Floridaenema evergladense BLCC-F167 TaxID=3153639 RepID=A0ABV4WDI6_9CYAN
MSDNLKQRGPEDPTKININQAYELGYWTTRLRVSEDVLRRAVKAVGPLVTDVQKWLNEHRYMQGHSGCRLG